MNLRVFMYYQTIVMMATSIVFPFYILLLNHVGNNYAQFGWAYGLFSLTAALFYPLIGRIADRIGDGRLFIIYSFGMAVLLLFLPLVTEVWQVYILQVCMGILGAIQKNTEKTALARSVKKETAGKEIGNYHVFTGIGAAIAIIIAGYLVDFLTIASIFYFGSLLYFLSGCYFWRKNR